MAWLYVPELGDSTLDSRSLAPTIEQSVTSRGRLMRRRYWSSAWKKGGWIRHLFGMTLPPLAGTNGVTSWTLSTLAYRVSHIQWPDDNKGNRTIGTSGPSSSASSVKCGPPWCSSRMSQDSLPGFDLSEINYRAWVTSLRQGYSQRQKLEAPTNDSDSSSWRSPGSTDGEGGVMEVRPSGSRRGHYKLRDQVGAYARNQYPTPSKTPYGSSQNEGQVPHDRPSRGTPSLETWAKNWATPAHRDWRSPNGKPYQDRGGGKKGEQLQNQVHFLQAQETQQRGQQSSRNGRKLNPVFVEWLMGYPIGWTAFEPVEMGSYLSQQRGLLSILCGGG